MRKLNGRGKEHEKIISLYEQGMTFYSKQMKKFLTYGGNDMCLKEEDKIDYSETTDTSFNRSASVYPDQFDIINN